jgi:uncharacterized UPF0146 family protein
VAEDKTRIFLSIRWNQLQRHPVLDAYIINRKELISGLRTLREMMGELVDVAEQLGATDNLKRTLDEIIETRQAKFFDELSGAKRKIEL